MSQINTYPMKNSTIQRISYDRDLIDTSPVYQRKGDIWNLEQRQLLVDSILNDYDIPKLYFHELPKPVKTETGKEVLYSIIDGRQRLETLWGFIDGKFPLSEDFRYFKDQKVNAGGLYYADLANKYAKLKVLFDSYVLPIVCVQTDDIELIEDMFSRLNEAEPLNAAEKRNAMGGPMARTIADVATHSFFTNKVRFEDNRYQHREVSARLLFLEDRWTRYKKIVDTKKPYLDVFVDEYKQNSDLNASDVANRVKNVLNEMCNIFADKDALLGTQSVVSVYFLFFKSVLKEGRLKAVTRDKLKEFRDAVMNNWELAQKDIKKADFDLIDFYRLSQQGTNDAASIKERVRILSERFGLEVPY